MTRDRFSPALLASGADHGKAYSIGIRFSPTLAAGAGVLAVSVFSGCAVNPGDVNNGVSVNPANNGVIVNPGPDFGTDAGSDGGSSDMGEDGGDGGAGVAGADAAD